MPKTDKELSVKLDGRVSEKTGGAELVAFISKKLSSGMTTSEFVRHAAEIYFLFETGKLFTESLRKALLEVLPVVMQNLNLRQIPSSGPLESASSRESRSPVGTTESLASLTERLPDIVLQINPADLAKIGAKDEGEMKKILEDLGVSSLDEAFDILQSIGGGNF